jgi:hypothetical protein
MRGRRASGASPHIKKYEQNDSRRQKPAAEERSEAQPGYGDQYHRPGDAEQERDKRRARADDVAKKRNHAREYGERPDKEAKANYHEQHANAAQYPGKYSLDK